MAMSMTGYGSEVLNTESWTISWEIKSVNSRYLDLKWRVPHTLYFMQGKWEKQLRSFASRGRVDISLNLRIHDPEVLGLTFDQTMAKAMLSQLKDFSQNSGFNFTPDLNIFLKNPSMWQEDKKNISAQLEDDLEKSLINALKNWNETRKNEGNLLLNDISERLSILNNLSLKLQDLAPDNTQSRFNDLKQRLGKLTEELSMEIDENRLLQELTIMADRLDVSEEITRLKAHLSSMEELLDKHAEIGRKLDFILQETFREINTCANKCQNTHMSRIAVDFKAELEKCREQTQNLE